MCSGSMRHRPTQRTAPAHVAASVLLACLPPGYETSDVGAVMDGGLDGFISAFLRQQGQREQEARLAAPTV